ncbi:MAG TPA: zinc ABC transporter substrate-binding protein [Candidatus Saccharimonadales bacterium]|jgi:zinc transport system substrate-binding protein|nr:zinc ABC transporter substrate-binding protein [Candidatus Saccharimonadales bacterium]
MIKKIFASVVLVALIIGGIVFAVHRTAVSSTDAGKLQVVASYYPMYDFAKDVGGDKISLTNVTPAGSEPHDYEPSPKVLAEAHKAKVFIYNGGHLEPWVNGFLSDYKNVAIKASQGIDLQVVSDETNATNQVTDPHFWLDPVLAAKIVDNVRDGLIKADPANASYYTKNAADYNVKLAALDTAYKMGLADCQIRTLITSHAAFGYLATRYNLDAQAIAGISPEEEPSAAKLAELTQLVKDRHIQYVFFESLVSPRLAATIASETGAKTLVFDPIEGLSDANQKQGKNYLTIQEQNLANLRTALACK